VHARFAAEMVRQTPWPTSRGGLHPWLAEPPACAQTTKTAYRAVALIARAEFRAPPVLRSLGCSTALPDNPAAQDGSHRRRAQQADNGDLTFGRVVVEKPVPEKWWRCARDGVPFEICGEEARLRSRGLRYCPTRPGRTSRSAFPGAVVRVVRS
jgi:hypothetical protein